MPLVCDVDPLLAQIEAVLPPFVPSAIREDVIQELAIVALEDGEISRERAQVVVRRLRRDDVASPYRREISFDTPRIEGSSESRFDALSEAEAINAFLRKPTRTHDGRTAHPEYAAWRAMHYRCRNPSCAAYRNFGGRGITVATAWHSYPQFLEDVGRRPPASELRRRDPDGPFSPENCHWGPLSGQHVREDGRPACPRCGSRHVRNAGVTGSGSQRWNCVPCRRRFGPKKQRQRGGVPCPSCAITNTTRRGRTFHGRQRWYCQGCKRQFLGDFEPTPPRRKITAKRPLVGAALAHLSTLQAAVYLVRQGILSLDDQGGVWRLQVVDRQGRWQPLAEPRRIDRLTTCDRPRPVVGFNFAGRNRQMYVASLRAALQGRDPDGRRAARPRATCTHCGSTRTQASGMTREVERWKCGGCGRGFRRRVNEA